MTYFDTLDKLSKIMIISKLDSSKDIRFMSDIIHITNIDYMMLCRMMYPQLFPIKFLYGDSIQTYNWRKLYICFLRNDKSYSNNLITGCIKNTDSLDLCEKSLLFMILIGKIDLCDIGNSVLKTFNLNSLFNTRMQEYINVCVVPRIYQKIFSNNNLPQAVAQGNLSQAIAQGNLSQAIAQGNLSQAIAQGRWLYIPNEKFISFYENMSDTEFEKYKEKITQYLVIYKDYFTDKENENLS